MDAGADALLDLFVSVEVLDEVTRNLANKSPSGIGYIDALLVARVLSMAMPASDDVAAVAEIVEAKDAHVIAAAMAVNAPVVATYDRRHLLSQAELILSAFGIEVLTPERILRRLDATDEQPAP